LVRQTHPEWTPEEVKAAVMTTAVTDVRTAPDGRPYGPNRVGNGRVDTLSALDNQVLAMVADVPGAVSVGFGTVEAAAPLALTRTVRMVNKGNTPVEYELGHSLATTLPGTRWELSTDRIQLTARGQARFTVTFKVTDLAALRKESDPTIESAQLKVARQFIADTSGWITFRPVSGTEVPLRLAVHAAPKPVADVDVPDEVTFAGNSAVLKLSGRGLDQGSGPAAYRSLVSVFQLQGSSPRLEDCSGSVKDDCAINNTAKGGDLRHVGAASTAPLLRQHGDVNTATVAFGIATWKDWYNLGSNTMPFVSIDTTGDGRPDFETAVVKPTGTDVLTANTVDLSKRLESGGFETVDSQPVNTHYGEVDTNVFDTNVVVLPVSVKALGIDPTKDSAKISYTVGVAGMYVAPADSDRLVDVISTPMTFDVLAPALWTQGGGDPALTYLARPGTALVVNRSVGTTSGELLVLNHHNRRDDRVATVRAAG
jgi:hypothetical protein